MAGRVNKKFVLLLVLVLVVLSAGAAGAWFYLKNRDPTNHALLADQLMAKGDYVNAAQEYQRAINRKPGDPTYLLKLLSAQAKIPVNNAEAAQGLITGLRRGYLGVLQIDPANTEALQQLFNLYQFIGEEGSVGAWDEMLKQAKAALDLNPDSLVAKKYRGIARINRMKTLDMTVEERQLALDDLRTALSKNPDDEVASRYLAVGDVLQARLLGQANSDPAKVKELRNEARKTVDAFVKSHPADYRARLDQVHVLKTLGDNERVSGLIDKIEAELLANPQPPAITLDATQAILESQAAGATSKAAVAKVLARGETLVRAGLKKYPDDLRLQLLLAQLLSSKDPPTEALELYRKVTDSPVHGLAIEAARAGGAKNMAMIRATTLLLTQAESAHDPQTRKHALDNAQHYLDQLATSDVARTAGGMINLLAGRAALLKGQPREALTKLDAASAAASDNSPEALFYAARACVLINEPGAAITRYTRLLELAPNFTSARYELAQLHLRVNQPDDAMQQVEAILHNSPDDRTALILKAEILGEMGRNDEAIAILKRLKPEENPPIALLLSQLYFHKGDKDQALATLDKLYSAHPADPQLLSRIISLAPTAEKKRAYIEMARKAGVDANILQILSSQISGNTQGTLDSYEKILAEEKDPLRRHLRLWGFYRQTNQPDKAAAELAEAAKTSPNNKDVINAKFDTALGQKNWDAAEKLAGHAAESNLDQAEGAFYNGRLEMARGRFDRAAADFTRGLTEQPVYSIGWRLKGDALRRNNDPSGAVAAYEKSLEQFPSNIEALRGVALAYDALQEYPDALAAIHKAYDLAPNDPATSAQYLNYEQQRGDKSVALKIREQIAKTTPSDAGNRRMLALLLSQLKRHDEAIQAADALLKEDPDNLGNAAVAAMVRQSSGRAAEGRQILKNYIDHKGNKATADDWATLARYILDEGDETAAMAAYRQAISLEDPATHPVSREMADVLFDRGELAQASVVYKKLYDAAPKDRQLGLRYTESLVRTQQFDAAEKVLAGIEGDGGENGVTLMLRAVIARGRGDNTAALALLDRAVEKAPNIAAIYVERAMLLATMPNHGDEVVATLKKAVPLSGQVGTKILLAQAMVNMNELEDAAQILRSILDTNPRDVRARVELANVYMRSKDFIPLKHLLDDAVGMFPKDPTWLRLQAAAAMVESPPNVEVAHQKLRAAYTLSPSPETLMDLVKLELDQRRPEAAVEWLHGQPDMVEKFPILRAMQGRALWMAKQTQEATNAFAKAIYQSQNYAQTDEVVGQMLQAMSPQDAIEQLKPLSAPPRKLWIEMLIAQLEIKASKFAAAASRLEGAESLLGNEPNLRELYYRTLSMAQYEAGDFEGVVLTYRAILKLKPNDIQAANNIAYVLAEDLHRPKDALPLAEKVAKALPNVPTVLDTLGWVQFRNGNVDAAYDTLRHSTEKEANPTNSYHLAEVLLTMGRKADAREMFETARRLAEQAKDKKTFDIATRRLKEAGL